MSRTHKILTYISLFLIVILTATCAPAKKNPYLEKRKKASQVNASQLGRNRYYFSKDYQKKLNKSYKKR